MNNIFNNYKDIGLFNSGDYLIFSFKKTEKIVSAIYLVTGLLKDNEPIKWELRDGSISLLSAMIALNTSEPVDKNKILQSFISSSVNFISILNISSVSGLISNMNSNILIKEITDLIDYLKDHSLPKTYASGGLILSDSFFNTDFTPINHKGLNNIKSTNNTNLNKDYLIKDKKNSRKDSILNLLKTKSDLTIKDFTKVITGCSEKTIQRELINLVEKGIVKKKGERRWSTYSLT